MAYKMGEIFLCVLFGVGIIAAVLLVVALAWIVFVDLIKEDKKPDE